MASMIPNSIFVIGSSLIETFFYVMVLLAPLILRLRKKLPGPILLGYILIIGAIGLVLVAIFIGILKPETFIMILCLWFVYMSSVFLRKPDKYSKRLAAFFYLLALVVSLFSLIGKYASGSFVI